MPKSLITDIVSAWERFLYQRQSYRDQIGRIGREYPFFRTLEISISDMHAGGKTILDETDKLYQKNGLEKVISSVKDAIARQSTLNASEVDKIRVRFSNDPRIIPIRNISTDYINQFITFEGIIRKISKKRPHAVSICFQCRMCNTRQKIPQFRGGQIDPISCINPDCKNKGHFSEISEESEYIDFQMCRIEEFPEGLRGSKPETFDIHLTGDLCERINPGDRVKISGILRVMPRKVAGERSTLKDWYLDANNIEINEKSYQDLSISEEDEEKILELSKSPEIYSMVANSIAPSIYGIEHIKAAISLQLFGGLRKEMPDGSTRRGDIHILMTGDPGIAKSVIMRNVIEISPRGILTSGKSATSAGLTASAVKDDFGNGGWTLEAGALVLADMGMAAVDELDKMSREDRSSLHEAMEQQSISISKAGIVATLNTRCSLLAAANPKLGRFDRYASFAEQIDLPPSLLSRFDLIFMMIDAPQAERDAAIAAQILDNHEYGEVRLRRDEMPERLAAEVTPPIDPVLLRKYIGYAKQNCVPRITPEARQKLIQYYLKVRHLADENKPIPLTARQLEALVRLAEASARVRLSETITIEDAKRVIDLVDTCLRQAAYDDESGSLDIDRLNGEVSAKTRNIKRLIERSVRDISGDGHKSIPSHLMYEYLDQHNIDPTTAKKTIKTLIDRHELDERGGKIILLN